jgi:c-di-GMP-related signal transduction protein
MEFFVIRQPIFDRQQHVFAYEILCRSQQSGALESFAGQADGTRILANSFLLIGFNRITRGKKAFIRFSKESLRSGLEFGLPRDLLVIELLEDVEPEETLINACKQSKAEGHLVALGGSACRPACPAAFLGIIDFIKVNFQETNSEDRKAIVDLAAPQGIKVLADGLETRAAFTAAMAAGCSYFQGDFFSKPVII